MRLRLDWCSYRAARYACERWHYSGCMPASKTVKVGVWEDGTFTGAIVFSRGATPMIGRPYGLDQTEVCELTRVALREHRAPVSRMLAVALKMLARFASGLRLVVSFADRDEGHNGGIYQASNWIYTGVVGKGARTAFIVHGRKVHPRSIGSIGGVQSLSWVREHMDPEAEDFHSAGKHKYLMPLDAAMRKQVEPLAKPYPKRERAGSKDSVAPANHAGEGGASPTPALQPNEAA